MTQESFIKNDKLVMKIQHYKNQDENFLFATYTYVAEGIAPLTRNYLDKELRTAIDLVLIKEIIQKEKGESALRIFANDLLSPKVLQDQSFSTLYTKVENISRLGLITKIFLIELSILANQLFPDHIGDKEIIDEANDFIDFLEAFVKRPRGQEGELTFRRKFFQLHIILLALQYKIRKRFSPYLDAIQVSIKVGCKNIYIFAYEQCLQESIEVATMASNKFQLPVKSKHKYIGVREDRSQIFMCIRLSKNQ